MAEEQRNKSGSNQHRAPNTESGKTGRGNKKNEAESSEYDTGIGIPPGKKVTESYDPYKKSKIIK